MFGLTAAALCLLMQVESTSPASLRVTVTDAATAEPVPGATVELADLARRGVTGSDGLVIFGEVPPGPQHVAVRRIGYRPHFLHALIGARGLSLVVVLTPMPLSLAGRRVESSPVLALRDIGRADSLNPIDRSLSAAAVRAHPLLSEPDAILAAVGGHVGARPESPGGIHVMGGGSDQIAYMIDGIPVFNPYHAGTVFGALNTDALHEVALLVSPLSSALSDALGGALTTRTRPTGERVQTSGGMSTSQSRLTMEIPLGRPSASGGPRPGLLLSGRAIFPALFAAKREPSHVDADGSDRMARLDLPLARGTLRLLAVGLGTSVSTSSGVQTSAGNTLPPRNDLEWMSHSYGATWDGDSGPWKMSAAVWRASTGSNVDWLADSVLYSLESALSETAGRASLSRSDSAGEWTLTGRLHQRRTVFVREGGATTADLRPRATLGTAFVSRRQRIGRSQVVFGSAMTRHGNGLYVGPFADVRLDPNDWITISTAAGRRHQFVQSLRNPESLVSNVFPVDLHLNAGREVPVARGDQATVAVQMRPSVARSFTVRGWIRSLSGLLLPTLDGDELAARSNVTSGTGRSRGLSVDVSIGGARVGVLASYALQAVRYSSVDTTWTPESGVTHSLDAGVRLFPDPTLSVSVAFAAVAGRHATPYAGAFEWEACNLRDRGCEFAAGSLARDGVPGGLTLPGYVRFDLGLRKHWHVRVGARDALLGAFMTWTNLLNRSNVLTLVRDPVSGGRSAVGMRPGSPLVVGLDWSI